jgi:hypothetical protein
MSKRVGFAAGLNKLEQLGGKVPAAPATATRPSPEAGQGDDVNRDLRPSGRSGKVNIAGYFDPAVRKQLAMLAIERDTDQVKLMAEALNLLFEKYGRSPIASA